MGSKVNVELGRIQKRMRDIHTNLLFWEGESNANGFVRGQHKELANLKKRHAQLTSRFVEYN
jgi:hypothetical protein